MSRLNLFRLSGIASVLGASILLLSLPIFTRTGPAWMAILVNVLLAAGPIAYGSALWRLAREHQEPEHQI